MLKLICNLLKALGVARGEQHHGGGMAGEHGFERTKKKRLFAIDGASANQDGACS